MLLILGGAESGEDFTSLIIPDEYAPADVLPLIVQFWGAPPPPWVASDSEALASAVAEVFEAEIRPLSGVFAVAE